MAQLEVKIETGQGFDDIAPAPGCCSDRVPSAPIGYFLLESTAGVWATEPAQIQGSQCTWQKTFTHIKCRDPESDRLEFYFVDGAHWKPDMRCGPENKNNNPPDQHFYGQYKMSVIQFERGKVETQTLVLQNKQRQDTKFSFTITGRFLDSNIDDARLEGGPPPAAAGAPPPLAMPGAAPVAVAAPVAQPAGWDGLSWPPTAPPAIAIANVPQGNGPPLTLTAGTHNQINAGNGGDESQGSDVGDQGMAGITVVANSKIHWASLYGKLVLYNCLCTAVDLMAGSDIHVFGGSFTVGENKGGRVTMH